MKKLILPFVLLASLCLGANVQVRDLTPVTRLPASNDYLLTDGATHGTAKNLLTNFPQITSTRATLAGLTITSIPTGVTVITLGGSAIGDGGGATYYYDSTSSATPNGVTIIQPTVGSGRWLISTTIGLPTPTISTLGGVFSKAAVTHQFLTFIGTDGSVGQSTISTGDISGLGTIATQAANNVTITGGTISGLGTPLAIASGGTGGNSASAARTALGVPATASVLAVANNLSDLASASTARTNLGLGSLATQSGTFSGTSSGTNTGDQTITLTGAVTGSGTGTFSTTIPDGTINLFKFTNAPANTFMGNRTGVSATPQYFTVAQAKTLLAYVPGDIPGFGGAALLNVGITAGTVAAGDDSRFIPPGGAAGASLIKTSATNYSVSWKAPLIIDVTAPPYNADPTGATDSSAAIAAAIAACAPDGTVSEILLNNYVGGFGPPSNSWTGRPSITLGGALNGASGFQAYGNVNTDGYMSSIEVANNGTGYNVTAYVCNRTNGSPIITLSSGTFDARIVAGVAVRFEQVSTACRVLTRDSPTQLTLTENMTFTNADQFVFGFPYVLVNGVASYDNLIPILGSPTQLYFPPGAYKSQFGLGNFGGLSNLTINAVGAEFRITNITGAIGATIRNSTGITWNGGAFHFLGARYQVPYNPGVGRSTRYPGQSGFVVGSSQMVTVNNVQVWDSFQFGIVTGGDSNANRFKAQRVYFNNPLVVNPLGDGIHVTSGSDTIRVSGANVIGPGDDALAVVNDGGGVYRPANVVMENSNVEGGVYRGLVSAGGDFVTFRNVYGKGTHGPFVWVAADGGSGTSTNVSVSNVYAEDLGNTALSPADTNSGIGISANTTTNLVLRDITFLQHSSVAGNNVLFNVNAGAITGLDWDQQQIEIFGTAVTFTGSANTDLDCQTSNGFAGVTLGSGRWWVEGSITARFSAGPGNTMWPVLFDGTTESGAGSGFQTNDQSFRNPMFCSGFINITSGTKNIRFKIKQSGGGTVIDAGTVAGYNSVMRAHRLP